MGDCIVASAESREFPMQILIPKKPDTFWHEEAWLSYFLREIVLWLLPRVKSSPTHFVPKRLGSPTFYRQLFCAFNREPKVHRASSDTKET
ncbi:hypothetical protein Csa_023488 [Cucumis sativus]|nr:hypothetical protein Csa_023488 [Cucumis sativus]